MLEASPLHQILDLARWAPSGDNTQPWRFEIQDGHRFVIHGRDTRSDCVYDLDGRASQLSLGALIETVDIAASAFGLEARCMRRADAPDERPTFDISLVPRPDRNRSNLIPAIPARSVHRRPMRLTTITDNDRAALSAAIGPEYGLLWFSSWHDRLRWATLLWINAGLRLRLPEAFEVHRRVIAWNSRFSADRIPDQAVGASVATRMVMRLAMTSWQRVDLLNTWLGGTIAPRLEMDWLPALACGAHIAIVAPHPPQSIDDFVSSGRIVQRFWLTATQLGLLHQPAVTPLVFDRYSRERRRFTETAGLSATAEKIALGLDKLLGEKSDRVIWLGRVGHGQLALARSERMALATLCELPK